MYKQRARDLAVNLEDSSTKYFYRIMRKRQTQAYISQIVDAEGNTTPTLIHQVLLQFLCFIFKIS